MNVSIDIQDTDVLFSTENQEWELFLVKPRHWEDKVFHIFGFWASNQLNFLPFKNDVAMSRITCDNHLIFRVFKREVCTLILVNHGLFLLIIDLKLETATSLN